MLSGCHVTRAQWGRNTKRRADKAQDWYSFRGGWRMWWGRERGRRWTVPLQAYPMTMDNWINQTYCRPSAASTVTSRKKKKIGPRKLTLNGDETLNMTYNTPVSCEDANLGINDKDPYILVLMPAIMTDTEADEACNPTPKQLHHCVEHNSLVVMLHSTAIPSLSDLPAANERLHSTSWDAVYIKRPHIRFEVMTFHIWTNVHLKSSCYHKKINTTMASAVIKEAQFQRAEQSEVYWFDNIFQTPLFDVKNPLVSLSTPFRRVPIFFNLSNSMAFMPHSAFIQGHVKKLMILPSYQSSYI